MKQLTKSNYGKQVTTLGALIKLSDKAKKVIYNDKIYSAKFLLNNFKHSDNKRIKEASIYEYNDAINITERPKYFVIKRNEGNPLWRKYIDWLNEMYGAFLIGNRNLYYGYDGSRNTRTGTNCLENISLFKNNPVLLTLDQWHDLF